MALFTGKGDNGTTGLFDSPRGARLSKSSPIFECLGQLDELNTVAGWAAIACPDDFAVAGRKGKALLRDVQDHLFTLQAEIAGAKKNIPRKSVEALGKLIGTIEKELPEIQTFLVPGGTEFASRLDIARAIARRAERRIAGVHESGARDISASSRAWANRLSSLFYALGRLANRRAGIVERPPRYRA